MSFCLYILLVRATAGRTAGTNFDLSTGWLAGGNHAEENFDLSTGQLNKEFRLDLS